MIRSTGNEDVSNFRSPLTGKFVRTFRKKERNGQLCWYHRSRLVAREYNYLSIREDTFSTASNSVVTRLIPAMVMSGLYSDDQVIGLLDISDAYLQVPQELKRRLKVTDSGGYDDLIIAKRLHGQRDGARRWYFFFCDFLEKQLGLVSCSELPSILKVRDSDGGCMLLHVDDVLFTMSSDFMRQTFLAVLKQAFKLSDCLSLGLIGRKVEASSFSRGFMSWMLALGGWTFMVKRNMSCSAQRCLRKQMAAKQQNCIAPQPWDKSFLDEMTQHCWMSQCLELTDHWVDAFCIFHTRGQMFNILSSVWLPI